MKSLGTYKPSEAKKEHYRNLGVWLRKHPKITFQKLSPFGFWIDTRTIPVELSQEFIETVTFKE